MHVTSLHDVDASGVAQWTMACVLPMPFPQCMMDISYRTPPNYLDSHTPSPGPNRARQNVAGPMLDVAIVITLMLPRHSLVQMICRHDYVMLVA